MPTPILMPALSPTMEKGNLAKWLKKEGDAVKSGDVIAEIETDKATMEVEAVDEGTLGKILVPEGTSDVAVNTPIAMILGEGEDAAALRNGQTAPAAATAPAPAHQEQATDARAAKDRNRCSTGKRRRAGAGSSGRHSDGHHDNARGAARRHGRRDAARS